jgi:hypothetical protein
MSSRSHKKKKQAHSKNSSKAQAIDHILMRSQNKKASADKSFHMLLSLGAYAIAIFAAFGTHLKTELTGPDDYENGIKKPGMGQHQIFRGDAANQELYYAENFLSEVPRILMEDRSFNLAQNVAVLEAEGVKDSQDIYIYHPCSFYEEKNILHKITIKTGHLRMINAYVDSLSAVSGMEPPKFTVSFLHFTSDPHHPERHSKHYDKEPAHIMTYNPQDHKMPNEIVASPVLLALLSPNEAKAVIAHEFGHILLPGHEDAKGEQAVDSIGLTLYPQPAAAMSALGKVERHASKTDFLSLANNYFFRPILHETHVLTLARAEKIEQHRQNMDMANQGRIVASACAPSFP